MTEESNGAVSRRSTAWGALVFASLACPVGNYFFVQSLKAPGTFSTGESGLIGYFAAMLVAVLISVAGLVLSALAVYFRKFGWIAIAAFFANAAALLLVLRQFL